MFLNAVCFYLFKKDKIICLNKKFITKYNKWTKYVF